MKKKAEDKVSKKIRTGDTVLVITGNYKGQNGKVLRKDGQYVTVQGINVRKKHVKKSQENPQGAVLEIEKPIHISNVQLSVNDKPVKVKVKTGKEGQRVLFYREGKKEVVHRELRKAASKK